MQVCNGLQVEKVHLALHLKPAWVQRPVRLRSSKQMIYTRKIGGGEDTIREMIPMG